jgi:hypothetical protein
MEHKIKMMAAASEALQFLRRNSKVTDEELHQHIADYIVSQNIRDYSTKFGMIAAATETYNIYMKESGIGDKEILRKVMLKIPEILQNIGPVK